MEGEVECIKKFGPPRLSPRERFRAREIFKVLVVREYVNWERGAFQMVTPDLECFVDCEEFLVVRIIVPFGRAERPRMEGNGGELSVGWTGAVVNANFRVLNADLHWVSKDNGASFRRRRVSGTTIPEDRVMKRR